MNFFTWLASKFSGTTVPLSDGEIKTYAEEYEAAYADLCIREMAFYSCVGLISKAVSKCEFKTFASGSEKKGAEYYMWNIEPNKNQNSTEFLNRLVFDLYRKNECLIVENSGQLLIADSYERKEYALYENQYKQVTVGDFVFRETFSESEVLFFKLNDENIKNVINAMYSSYGKLITYEMESYLKSKGFKGILEYDTIPIAGTEARTLFDKLIEEKLNSFTKKDRSILPLGKGLKLTPVSEGNGRATSRDIRAMVDDIYSFTAKAYGIPAALISGDVQGVSDAVDSLLTFCIDPLADLIGEEINRKRYGEKEYAKGNKLTIDTKAIKHVDLLSVSTAIDKLISSGAFSINDIRKLVGENEIQEEWAEKHYITKNYDLAENSLKEVSD